MFCLLSIFFTHTAEFDRPEEETEVVLLSHIDGWWSPILTFLIIQCSAADWGLHPWYVPLCSVTLCSFTVIRDICLAEALLHELRIAELYCMYGDLTVFPGCLHVISILCVFNYMQAYLITFFLFLYCQMM